MSEPRERRRFFLCWLLRAAAVADPNGKLEGRAGRMVWDGEAIVDACPGPCLMISSDGIIERVNEAFIHLLQARHEDLRGQPVDRYFRIRGDPRLGELSVQLADGSIKAVPANLAYVVPGRVIVAKAYLCPMAVSGHKSSCLVMLDNASAR
jgi:PAS domain-containing protein